MSVRWNRAVTTDRLVCAPISRSQPKLCLSFQTIRSRTRPTLPSWFWIMSAAAMINDGLHANIHRHKTINNGTERKFRNFIDFLLLCRCCCCCCCYCLALRLYVHTPHRTEEDEEEEEEKTATEGKTIFCWFCLFLVSRRIYALLLRSLLAQFTGLYWFFCSVELLLVNVLIGYDFPVVQINAKLRPRKL